MAEQKIKVGFRLYAEVQLTADELKNVIDGDSSSIAKAIEDGTIKLGNGDSYIPSCWLVDNNPDLPKDIKDSLVGVSDIEVYV